MTDFIGPDPSMPIIRARVHGEVSDRLQILADGTFLKGDGTGTLVESGGAKLDQANTFTPASDVTPLIVQQPAGSTKDQLVIKAQPGATRVATITFGGDVDTGPLFHFNSNGFGLLGDGTNAPPYFAIEDAPSSTANFNSVLKISQAGPTARHSTIAAYSKSGAATPELRLQSHGPMRLSPGVNGSGVSTGAGFIYAQVDTNQGIALTDPTGNGDGQVLLTRTSTLIQWRAYNLANGANKVDSTFKTSGHITLAGGTAQNGTAETSGYVMVRSATGFKVDKFDGTGTIIRADASTAKLAFFGVTPVAQQTLTAAATDAATTQALANSLRTALVNLGLGV